MPRPSRSRPETIGNCSSREARTQAGRPGSSKEAAARSSESRLSGGRARRACGDTRGGTGAGLTWPGNAGRVMQRADERRLVLRYAHGECVTGSRRRRPAHRYTAALAREIERSWQDRWDADGTFESPNPAGPLADPDGVADAVDRKLFVLDMFPYPSGTGLHVGHPLGFTGTDVYARYQRMAGPQRAVHDGLRRLRPAGRAVRRADRAPIRRSRRRATSPRTAARSAGSG